MPGMGRMILGPLEIDFDNAWLRNPRNDAKLMLGPRAADVVVYRDGDNAVAIDSKGRIISKSTIHDNVINDAINYLSSNGGGLLKLNGVFTISSPIVIKSNIILSGNGSSTKIVIADNANINAIENPSAEPITDVVIQNITIDGNRSNQSSNGIGINIGYGVAKSNITIRNVKIINMLSHAIWVDGSVSPKNILIDNVYISNSYSGIAGYNHENVTVRKVYIENVDWEGIHLTGNSSVTPAYVSKRPRIYDVIIVNSGGNGIDISYTEGAIVSGFYISSCGVKGINGEPLSDSAHSDIPEGDRAVIENGIIENCSGSGIYITYGYRTRIRNVYVINCGQAYAGTTDERRHGIVFAVEHGVIENVVVSGSGGSGIKLNLNSKYARIIRSYLISNNEHGIHWYNPQYGIIAYNVVMNNGQSGTGYNGIHIEGSLASFRTLVIGNASMDLQTTKTQEYGIYETSTATTFTGDNIIAYNVVPSGLQAVGSIYKSGSNTKVLNNLGYVTQNSGKATFSGDGTTTQFTIAHGLISAPSKVVVTPCSADASGQFYVTADATNIYVNYSTAPPAGTDNVCLYWEVEV